MKKGQSGPNLYRFLQITTGAQTPEQVSEPAFLGKSTPQPPAEGAACDPMMAPLARRSAMTLPPL